AATHADSELDHLHGQRASNPAKENHGTDQHQHAAGFDTYCAAGGALRRDERGTRRTRQRRSRRGYQHHEHLTAGQNYRIPIHRDGRRRSHPGLDAHGDADTRQLSVANSTEKPMSARHSNLRTSLSIAFALLSATAPACAIAQISVVGNSVEEKTAVAGDTYIGTIVVRNLTSESQPVSIYQSDYSFFADGTSHFDPPGSV